MLTKEELAPVEPTSETPTDVQQPSALDVEEYKEPVNVEDIPPKIKANVAARKAVSELLELAETEPTFKDNMTPHFWKVMLDECIKRDAKLPVETKDKIKIEPLDDRKTRILLKEKMESGQFLGMSVGTLIKRKQTAYLKDFATAPSRFQKQLLRLFARGDKNLIPNKKQAAKKEPKDKKEPQKKSAEPAQKPAKVETKGKKEKPDKKKAVKDKKAKTPKRKKK